MDALALRELCEEYLRITSQLSRSDLTATERREHEAALAGVRESIRKIAS